MDEIEVKEIVDDVLDNMIAQESFKDEELIPFYVDCVGDTPVSLNASDMDKVLNALQARIQFLLREGHYATRGK